MAAVGKITREGMHHKTLVFSSGIEIGYQTRYDKYGQCKQRYPDGKVRLVVSEYIAESYGIGVGCLFRWFARL
jgi:hypothetical protein